MIVSVTLFQSTRFLRSGLLFTGLNWWPIARTNQFLLPNDRLNVLYCSNSIAKLPILMLRHYRRDSLFPTYLHPEWFLLSLSCNFGLSVGHFQALDMVSRWLFRTPTLAISASKGIGCFQWSSSRCWRLLQFQPHTAPKEWTLNHYSFWWELSLNLHFRWFKVCIAVESLVVIWSPGREAWWLVTNGWGYCCRQSGRCLWTTIYELERGFPELLLPECLSHRWIGRHGTLVYFNCTCGINTYWRVKEK